MSWKLLCWRRPWGWVRKRILRQDWKTQFTTPRSRLCFLHPCGGFAPLELPYICHYDSTGSFQFTIDQLMTIQNNDGPEMCFLVHKALLDIIKHYATHSLPIVTWLHFGHFASGSLQPIAISHRQMNAFCNIFGQQKNMHSEEWFHTYSHIVCLSAIKFCLMTATKNDVKSDPVMWMPQLKCSDLWLEIQSLKSSITCITSATGKDICDKGSGNDSLILSNL